MSNAVPPPQLERNIRALVERRRTEERRKTFEERVADRITAFAGSMWSVYLHLVIFGAWIVVNLGWLPVRPFDPDFVKLAMVASVEAIFLSTFVLISQNRMAALAEERAGLDLHVGLLAEHEVTRTLAIVRLMAERMGIKEAADPVLHQLAQDVLPETVLAKMDEVDERAEEAEGRGAPEEGTAPAERHEERP